MHTRNDDLALYYAEYSSGICPDTWKLELVRQHARAALAYLSMDPKFQLALNEARRDVDRIEDLISLRKVGR